MPAEARVTRLQRLALTLLLASTAALDAGLVPPSRLQPKEAARASEYSEYLGCKATWPHCCLSGVQVQDRNYCTAVSRVQHNTAVSKPTSGSNKHQHCSKRLWHLQELQLALLGVADIAPLAVLVEDRPAPLLDQLLGHPPVGCGFIWQLEKEEHHLEADSIKERGLQELIKAPELLTK